MNMSVSCVCVCVCVVCAQEAGVSHGNSTANDKSKYITSTSLLPTSETLPRSSSHTEHSLSTQMQSIPPAPVYLTSIPSQAPPLKHSLSHLSHDQHMGPILPMPSRTTHTLTQNGLNMAIPLNPPVIMPSPLDTGEEMVQRPPSDSAGGSVRCDVALQTSFSSTPPQVSVCY